jgi:hypothetical protein
MNLPIDTEILNFFIVWVAIGLVDKFKLVFIDENQKRKVIEISYMTMKSFEGWTKHDDRLVCFQQDVFLACCAHTSVKWIQDQFGRIENWSTNSPDFSVLDNLCAVMKRNVSTRSLQTMSKLKRILMEE